MNEFKIDKGISLPVRGKQPFPIKYPWITMEMGDSFFIPLNGGKLTSLRVGVSIDLRKFNSESVKKYSITTRVENDGIRVWRIK